MKGHHGMSALVFASGETNIPYNTHKPPSRDKHPVTVTPNLLQLLDKLFVFGDVSKLPLAVAISFQGPVRGGSNDQMDGLVRKKGKLACIGLEQVVLCRDLLDGDFDLGEKIVIFGDMGDLGLWVVEGQE